MRSSTTGIIGIVLRPAHSPAPSPESGKIHARRLTELRESGLLLAHTATPARKHLIELTLSILWVAAIATGTGSHAGGLLLLSPESGNLHASNSRRSRLRLLTELR